MVWFFTQFSTTWNELLEFFKNLFGHLKAFFLVFKDAAPFVTVFNDILPMFIVIGILATVGIRVVKIILDMV